MKSNLKCRRDTVGLNVEDSWRMYLRFEYTV